MTFAPIAREQHIRREKATSNICTSQALLANLAAMYAVYHGADGLKAIASKVHFLTQVLAHQLEALGYKIKNQNDFFDTLTIETDDAARLHQVANDHFINLRRIDNNHAGVTLDESVTPDDLVSLINAFAFNLSKAQVTLPYILSTHATSFPEFSPSFSSSFARSSEFLKHQVFNTHHSETEMLRYIHHLQSKDLSLVHGMIPLGSCTMKLNATTTMIPVTYPGFSNLHPFAPVEQAQGYHTLIKVSDLINWVGFFFLAQLSLGIGERSLQDYRVSRLFLATQQRGCWRIHWIIGYSCVPRV